MKYVCIHGHFYQPPRENPWLETIELQDSAYPYHDWNERITAECYAPNAASRILDGEGRIVKILNNYSRISFNFGPTLLAWMESKMPDVYEAILAADRESQRTFSGHGSALAQAHCHLIMPLANRRDKQSQIIWGIRDFQRRFGRDPEGMWLPEAAVDLETLDLLAEHNIKFTILAPHQARRVRKIGNRTWRDVTSGKVDPTMAYQLRTPSGKNIDLFFYDGPISRAVAFEGLLNNGEHFSRRLMSGFNDARTWPQLIHIATDGETYGHHHWHGEMALAYALEHLENNGARLTNYGEYLDRHRPTHAAEIVENTSWSCAHGVDRWRGDCGCNSGGRPGWNQAWRGPLRAALDWLRDTLAPCYEHRGSTIFRDPWAARDDYIDVILDRSPEVREQFFSRHAARELSDADTITALKLLELERHAMLMYTSCGWFFDELSGIETVQVIQYAGRVLQLAQDLFGDSLEQRFLERLAQAKSNIPEHGDGRQIYEKFVRPAKVDLAKVAAHYGVSSLFEQYPEQAGVYCYSVDREDYRKQEAGRASLALGRARFTSEITQESSRQSFGVVHFGDHNLNCGVRDFEEEQEYFELIRETENAFSRADLPAVIRSLDRHFQTSTYSLRSLFRDEQRKILNQILDSNLAEAEAVYRQLYEAHVPLMRFLTDLGTPVPKAFRTAGEFAVNSNLRRALSEDEPDVERITALLQDAKAGNIPLDAQTLEFTLRKTIERLAEQLRQEPSDLALLENLDRFVGLVRSLPFEVVLWKVQNICYEMLQSAYREFLEKADQGDETARAWADRLESLARKVAVRVPAE